MAVSPNTADRARPRSQYVKRGFKSTDSTTRIVPRSTGRANSEVLDGLERAGLVADIRTPGPSPVVTIFDAAVANG